MRASLAVLLVFSCVVVSAKELDPPRRSDYLLTGGLAIGALAAYKLIPQQEGSFSNSNFLDDAGRSAFRLTSAGQRHDAHNLSNFALAAAIAWPVVVVPVRKGSTIAVTNINAQAFALTAILTGTTKALVGRERPYVTECRRNPSYDPGCRSIEDDESLKSFYSGHSVYAFTGAGLTCFYSDGHDPWACGATIGLASAVALLRVTADKHYVTDVSTGAVIGLFAGYVFPRWLHQPTTRRAGYTIMPIIDQDSMGAWLKAAF